MEQEKSFSVVQAEVKDMLQDYFEENRVPYGWEAKILSMMSIEAMHNQFSSHEEDIIRFEKDNKHLKTQVQDLSDKVSRIEQELTQDLAEAEE